jgi:truncated hemoglobin YjbI
LLDQGKDSEAVSAYQQYYARRFPVRAQQLPEVSSASELRDVLSTGQAARNLAHFDATVGLARDKLIDAYEIHFYEKWDNVPALLDLLHASLPSDLPLQVWELGQFWPGAPTDEHVHADELQRAVNGFLDGGAQRVIWLPLAYNPNGRNQSELRFGLVDPDGRVRESGRVFAQIAAAHART